MRYQLNDIHHRPWTLNGLSLPLIESHYENNYARCRFRREAHDGGHSGWKATGGPIKMKA
jgi:hypothetical protein